MKTTNLASECCGASVLQVSPSEVQGKADYWECEECKKPCRAWNEDGEIVTPEDFEDIEEEELWDDTH